MPHAAIDAIHVLRATCHDANWHPTAHDLAIGGQVRLNTKPRLRATRMNAKARDHFIENQNNTRFLR